MSLTNRFDAKTRQTLLDLAAESIGYGLRHSQSMPVNIKEYPPLLQQNGASFVTLKIAHQLRGCIGTLEAYRPLVEDIVDNAFAAAFRDPRFSPLTDAEFNKLKYHISILNPAEAMQFKSEADLAAQLHPTLDGLILSDQGRRGTFLPSVWESLPEPADFLHHLKMKAGFASDYWSDTLSVERYTVEEFGD